MHFVGTAVLTIKLWSEIIKVPKHSFSSINFIHMKLKVVFKQIKICNEQIKTLKWCQYRGGNIPSNRGKELNKAQFWNSDAFQYLKCFWMDWGGRMNSFDGCCFISFWSNSFTYLPMYTSTNFWVSRNVNPQWLTWHNSFEGFINCICKKTHFDGLIQTQLSHFSLQLENVSWHCEYSVELKCLKTSSE